jgi:glycosyltransferase involved in cell wall biosynthesis
MYIDHTASLSGGEIALLRFISALDRKAFEPGVVLFSDGNLVAALREISIEPIIMPLPAEVLDARKESLTRGLLFRFGALLGVAKHISSVRELILREKPALVHTNSLKADIIGGIAARLAGVPVIWHIHDRIAPDYLPPFTAALFRTLSRLIPNYVIANSQATMKTLQLPPGKKAASVVYCGIEKPDSVDKKDTVAAHAIGAVKDISAAKDNTKDGECAETVGLIGRISPWKGQKEFIDAAAIVLRERSQTRFEITGSPMFGEDDYLLELHRQIEKLGLADSVRLTGFSNDISDVLSRLTVFVHASVLPEPFGQTVLEAMAAGVPCIATNAGAIPEIVDHEETGLLVPPGDAAAMAQAILRLLRDREFALQLAARAQKIACERFDITLAAGRIQRIYESILGIN